MREDKKKKRADQKKAEEEKKKKSDQEKANSVTISPPSTNDDDAPIDLEDDTMNRNFDEETTTQTDGDWTRGSIEKFQEKIFLQK